MALKVLIIEDEKLAADKLIRRLQQVDPGIKVTAVCQSVAESIKLLREEKFDLIFSDIHLSDGLSFRIFQETRIDTPVIFTTAYDQYAMEAFKTNSIDYLLKPIRKEALAEALHKYKRLHQSQPTADIDFGQLIQSLQGETTSYKERFLVQAKGSELASIHVSDIAYFYADGKYTFIVTHEAKRYFSDNNISHLVAELDPKSFFQISRKFIVHINSIRRIIRYSKSRLKLELHPPTDLETLVSAERASEFKIWLGK